MTKKNKLFSDIPPKIGVAIDDLQKRQEIMLWELYKKMINKTIKSSNEQKPTT